MKEGINQKDSEGNSHGKWVEYDDHGEIWYRCNFHHGKLHGMYEYHNSRVVISHKLNFDMNIRSGLGFHYDFFGKMVIKEYVL